MILFLLQIGTLPPAMLARTDLLAISLLAGLELHLTANLVGLGLPLATNGELRSVAGPASGL